MLKHLGGTHTRRLNTAKSRISIRTAKGPTKQPLEKKRMKGSRKGAAREIKRTPAIRGVRNIVSCEKSTHSIEGVISWARYSGKETSDNNED